ncbi:3-hydroxyacyl-CoA dehydrogenase family protein [Massilia sp. LjRoot122]|uniref:3-hydroxyacyl-CoA dehydrogenase family protein n=1 Tax=Massilia sp. LjRoot122 TaxID=3342257 RepID=UPI003ED03EC6
MSIVNHEVQVGLAPPAIKRVGILGASTIGVGIAMQLLEADIPVTIFDVERSSLDEGLAVLRHGAPDVACGDRRMALLAGTINFHHLKDCDLVIEAVSTDIGVKEKLFGRLDQVVKPGAILVTCSSASDVDHLAGFTRRRGEVLGLHVPSPPRLGATWTTMPGKGSSDQAVATVTALVQELQQASALSGVCRSDAANDGSTMQGILPHAVSWQIAHVLE